MTTQSVFSVSSDPSFRREVAEAVVREAHPGYSIVCQGGYYADPVDGRVYFREAQAAWNPWSDDVDFRIVGVEQLVDNDGNDFSPEIDWKTEASNLLSFGDMIAGYLESEGEELEPNGDTPDWVDYAEVIAWAVEHSAFSKEIQDYEAESYEAAVNFAQSSILDSIAIDAE